MRTVLIIASLLAAFTTPLAAQKIIQVVPAPAPKPYMSGPTETNKLPMDRIDEDIQRDRAQRQPTNEMRKYAQRLEGAILDAGISVSVWASSEAGIVEPALSPYLHLFGYFSKATIYQLVKEGRLLEAARKIGFRGVDFQSKADGHYVFDLSNDGPIPRCANYDRVCW